MTVDIDIEDCFLLNIVITQYDWIFLGKKSVTNELSVKNTIHTARFNHFLMLLK